MQFDAAATHFPLDAEIPASAQRITGYDEAAYAPETPMTSEGVIRGNSSAVCQPAYDLNPCSGREQSLGRRIFSPLKKKLRLDIDDKDVKSTKRKRSPSTGGIKPQQLYEAGQRVSLRKRSDQLSQLKTVQLKGRHTTNWIEEQQTVDDSAALALSRTCEITLEVDQNSRTSNHNFCSREIKAESGENHPRTMFCLRTECDEVKPRTLVEWLDFTSEPTFSVTKILSTPLELVRAPIKLPSDMAARKISMRTRRELNYCSGPQCSSEAPLRIPNKLTSIRSTEFPPQKLHRVFLKNCAE